MKVLIVTEPFASYAKGDQIATPDEIAAAEATNPFSVVAVVVDDASVSVTLPFTGGGGGSTAPEPEVDEQPAK